MEKGEEEPKEVEIRMEESYYGIESSGSLIRAAQVLLTCFFKVSLFFDYFVRS